MSEEKKGQKEKPAKAEPEAKVVEYGARQKKENNRWTLARCLKAAKRFDNPTAWKDGAPSSYKAANAHGWQKECCAHMSAKNLPAAKKAGPKKKAAGKARALPMSA